MKQVLLAISAIGSVGGVGVGTASAMPHVDMASAAVAPAAVEARLVCDYRRCRHTGYYRHDWYRPYGYYRPYRAPQVGIGPFGAGVY